MKSIVLTTLIFLFISCEKDDISSIDPNILIQGKWEIIALGNGEDLDSITASGYREFYQDSLIRVFDYETDTFIENSVKYEIDDSLLYKKVYYPSVDETWIWTYRYEFLEENQKLRLEHKDFYAMNSTSLYKRIN